MSKIRRIIEAAGARRVLACDDPLVPIALDVEIALLAARLKEKLPRIADRYVERLGEEAPEWTVERRDLADTIIIGARESIGAELAAFADGERLPAQCPELDAEGARQCVRLGVPLDELLLQYRLGHEVQWEAWLDLVEAHDVAPSSRRALLDRGSRFFFAYADRMSRFATWEYARERERQMRGHEQRRAYLVQELLAGRHVDASALGYALSGFHIG